MIEQIFGYQTSPTIVEKLKFPNHFIKIILCYKRKEYNTDVITQFACLAVDPVMVDPFAKRFNCTPVAQGSDPMMAPT